MMSYHRDELSKLPGRNGQPPLLFFFELPLFLELSAFFSAIFAASSAVNSIPSEAAAAFAESMHLMNFLVRLPTDIPCTSIRPMPVIIYSLPRAEFLFPSMGPSYSWRAKSNYQ
ncbi:hypothetical protein [Pseudomonas amygdali]|uniref:hypothetical protein n=1 Tax=Pseudomonas amygdali TaxID=47877 RepID=UPI00167630C8|nr:hypothetical protein [Pseudomonas amygdali]